MLCADPGAEADRDRLAKGGGNPPDLPTLRRKVFSLDAAAGGPRGRAWAMDGERTWFAVSAVVGALRTATPPDDEAVTDALQALRQVSENLGS